MKKITINSKDYNLKPIDFNAVCELEDLGLDVSALKSKSMSTARALLAFHGGISVEEAGKEIMEHFKNRGTIDDLSELFNHLAESDFFQTIRQPSKAEETQPSKGKAKV